MFFSFNREIKREEKKRREFMAQLYPPGYSTEPKRQPNPDYKLQTTKEELIKCLMVYDHMRPEIAAKQAAHMLEWIPQSLKENLDEAAQRKPLSNIIFHSDESLAEAIGFFYHDKTIRSVYFAIYYLSAELAGVLPTPEDWIEMRKQALEEC